MYNKAKLRAIKPDMKPSIKQSIIVNTLIIIISGIKKFTFKRFIASLSTRL